MRSRLLLLGLAFCALGAARDATLKGGNILACETYSFRSLIQAGKLDMTTIPELYKEEGIKGISYNDLFFKSLDDAYVDQIKEAVRKAGRVVTCFVMEGNLATADENERRAQVKLDEQKLRVAQRLGAPVVRINLGDTGKDNADDTQGVERAIAAFLEMLPLARELHIKMVMENHGGVSRNAANIVRIIRATDPQWVGALVDFGNFPPASRYDQIAALAPYALVTHVKIGEFDEKGEARNLDFPRILKTLKAATYKGPISIEYEGNGDPLDGVRKTKALILKYW